MHKIILLVPFILQKIQGFMFMARNWIQTTHPWTHLLQTAWLDYQDTHCTPGSGLKSHLHEKNIPFSLHLMSRNFTNCILTHLLGGILYSIHDFIHFCSFPYSMYFQAEKIYQDLL